MTRLLKILPAIAVSVLLSGSVALAADSDFKAGWDANVKAQWRQSIKLLTSYIDGKPSDKHKLATAYWLRAQDHHQVREWEACIADSTQSISLEPEDPIAYHFRASAYLMERKNTEALEDIDRSLARHPKESAHLYGMRAHLMLGAKNDPDTAIDNATKAINQYPKYADAYEIRANAYESKLKYDLALNDWNTLLKLDPKRPTVPAHRYRCLIALGKISPREFETVRKSKQNSDGAMSYQMGLALFNSDKVSQAFPYIEESLKINPKLTDAYLFRAICYKAMGKYELALRDLNKFLVTHPNYADAYYERAEVYTAMHRTGAALTDYNKLESMNPKYVNTFVGRGTLYTKLGDYDKATSEFKKGLDLDPHNAGIHMALGQLYEDQMLDDKAIAEYREVLHQDKNNQGALIKLHRMVRENSMRHDSEQTTAALIKSRSPSGYANEEAGKALQQMGKFDEAIEQYTKVLAVLPTSYMTHWHRAQCLMRVKKFDAALADWNAVVSARPKSVDAIRSRGDCYLQLKKPAEALKDLDKAISMAPTVWELYELRCNAYTQLGKTEMARQDYERALSLREKTAHDLNNDIFPPKKR